MKTGLLTHEASFRTSVEDRARAKAMKTCNRARDSLDDVHRDHRPQRLACFPLISRERLSRKCVQAGMSCVRRQRPNRDCKFSRKAKRLLVH